MSSIYYFFGKRKNDTHKAFHILKMKACFEKEPYSETHFENENMFMEKWKVINLFFLKTAIGKKV